MGVRVSMSVGRQVWKRVDSLRLLGRRSIMPGRSCLDACHTRDYGTRMETMSW